MNPNLVYEELTPNELAFITNGCGAKYSWLPAPDWIFRMECEMHDLDFWVGGDNADMIDANDRFLGRTQLKAEAQPWWSRWFYKLMSRLYYNVIESYGAAHFHFADRKRDRRVLHWAMELQGLKP